MLLFNAAHVIESGVNSIRAMLGCHKRFRLHRLGFQLRYMDANVVALRREHTVSSVDVMGYYIYNHLSQCFCCCSEQKTIKT